VRPRRQADARESAAVHIKMKMSVVQQRKEGQCRLTLSNPR
jgi:hypothetical protein